MNTNEQAAQLRLAADIIETNHPWQRKSNGTTWIYSGATPLCAVANGDPIRLVLTTPSDNRPLHNPDNLTAEQVGAGWRLCLVNEVLPASYEYWHVNHWCTDGRAVGMQIRPDFAVRRVPLSTPWPEVEKSDPYAELKAAHKAGKVIQSNSMFNGVWHDEVNPLWNLSADQYRIKPEEPAFQLPPPPPGMRWHREDGWRAGDLPPGYRPLVLNEEEQRVDEFCYPENDAWCSSSSLRGLVKAKGTFNKRRTTRPLVFQHAGATWTWHKPGDPCPCDGGAKIHILLRNEEESDEIAKAIEYDWSEMFPTLAHIIGWRYASTTREVELGPEDVPFGSVFTFGAPAIWVPPMCVSADGVGFPETEAGKPPVQKFSFAFLREVAKINRSLSTGKWNPEAWVKCSKEVPA